MLILYLGYLECLWIVWTANLTRMILNILINDMKKWRHIKSRNQDLLRNASIYDLIYRVAVHKQKNGKLDGTIKDIDLYKLQLITWWLI